MTWCDSLPCVNEPNVFRYSSVCRDEWRSQRSLHTSTEPIYTGTLQRESGQSSTIFLYIFLCLSSFFFPTLSFKLTFPDSIFFLYSAGLNGWVLFYQLDVAVCYIFPHGTQCSGTVRGKIESRKCYIWGFVTQICRLTNLKEGNVRSHILGLILHD